MTNPNILGVDPSWTGFAMCSGASADGKDFALEEKIVSTKPDKFKTHYHRLDHHGDAFMDYVDWVFPELVVFEGYARNVKNGREEAGELGGHCRWLLTKAEIPFIVAPPSVLKKFVTGKGTAAKELVMMKTAVKWGYEAANNNACDAYVLMRIGWWYHCHLRGGSTTKSLQAMFKTCEAFGV